MEDAFKELGRPTTAFPALKTGDPTDPTDPKARSNTIGGSQNKPRRISREDPSSSLIGQVLKERLMVAVLLVLLVLVLLLLLATLYLGAGLWEATRSLRVIAEVMSRQEAAATAGKG